MKKFRLAKNKYDHYKIQERKNFSVFGLYEIKQFEKWIDVVGYQMYGEKRVMKFKSKNMALNYIKELIRKDKFNDSDWSYEDIT